MKCCDDILSTTWQTASFKSIKSVEKILYNMAFAVMRLIVAIVAVSIVTGFSPLQSRSLARFSKLSMAFEFTPPSFDSILQKFGGSTSPATPTTVAPVSVQSVVAAPVAAAQAVQKIISVPPVAPSTALSGGEFSIGLGLGLLPYLLLPVLALNAVKGLLKPPKPLPVPVEPTTTVGAYTKSLQEGINEGIKELFSEQTADTDLTKKGIKLSAAGFGSAIVLTAVLFATSNAKEESKVIAKKPVVPAAIVKIVTPPIAAPISPPAAPVSAVSAPAPVAVVAPATVAAPVAAIDEKVAAEKAATVKAASDKAATDKAASDKAASEKAASDKIASDKAATDKAASDKAVSDKAASDKASSDKAASEKAASDKAASEKAASEKAASEKIASDKAASEKAATDKAASDKAASEKAASEKAASEKLVSDKAASDKAASEKAASEKAVSVPVSMPAKIEQKIAVTYTPVVPAGMQPDKVDFEALKLLRVSAFLLHDMIT